MKAKKMMAAMTAAAMTVGLAGTAMAEEAHNPVTLKITYAGGDVTATAITEKLLNDFQAANDWITVVQDASTSGSYDDYLATLANTGDFPDVVIWDEFVEMLNAIEADGSMDDRGSQRRRSYICCIK